MTSSCPAMMNQIVEKALYETIQQVQVRGQVADCLQEMISDIELAHQLQESLRQHRMYQQLHTLAQQQEMALIESHLIRSRTRQQYESWGSQLMSELWTLSMEMGKLQEIRDQYDQLLTQYDAVVAKCMQTEEDLLLARQQQQQQGQHPLTDTSSQQQPAATAPTLTAKNDTTQTTTATTVSSTATTGATASGDVATPATEAADDALEGGTTMISDGVSGTAGADTAARAASAATPVIEAASTVGGGGAATSTSVPKVSLDDDDSGMGISPGLCDLENNILMRVFAYLDALDILNTAQVNVSMYSRVDTLFGLGGGIGSSGGGGGGNSNNNNDRDLDHFIDQDTLTTTTSWSDSYYDVASVGAGGVVTAANATVPTISSTTTAPRGPSASTPPRVINSATGANPALQLSTATSTMGGTVVQIPPPAASTAAAAAAASVATKSTAVVPATSATGMQSHRRTESTSSNEGLRGIFASMLQAGRGAAGTSTATSSGFPSSASSSPTRASAAGGGRSAFAETAPPMNAAMANSMAAKLTDAELNAIILMTDRLRQREQLVDRLARENQALLARFEGMDSIKQFLIGRVREMESVMSQQEEQETKIALQIASDQEVIAFLDGRVQELEQQNQQCQQDQQRLTTEYEQVRASSEKKVMVLSDMLQFERERRTEYERDWKATKKVLIKEIKSCRAHIVALTAERDGYREQNEYLRRAVLSPATSSAAAVAPW